MTTPVLTEDGKRLEDALVKADHEFKAHPTVFHPARRGDKTFEFRKDDRGGYYVGQTVCLRCYTPETGYTDDAPLYRVITDILRPGEFGLQEGYCILSLRPLNTAAASLRLPLEGDASLREADKKRLSTAIDSAIDNLRFHHQDSTADELDVATDNYLHAALSTTPPAEAKTPDAGVESLRRKLVAFNVRDEVDQYEFCGDEGDYTPTERERVLLEDFGNGLASAIGDALFPTAPAGEDDTGVREALAADVLQYIQSSENGLSRVPRQLLCRIEDVLRSGCAPQPPKAETPAGGGDTGRVPMPKNADQAALMHLVGYRWLQHNAPERLVQADAALSTAPAARPGGEVERVRHVKRGTEYEVLGEAEAQVSTVSHEQSLIFGDDGDGHRVRWIADYDKLTVYRDPTSGKLWCRFTDEFRDGRFVPAAAPAADGWRA